MSPAFMGLPELAGPDQLVRIPPELDVPISTRVRAVLDSIAMQRLKRISQLGLVSQVYPGAVHSRFEHSLGVYRLACLVLKQLARVESEIAQSISSSEAKIFLLAALLHDVGHWPYCHPIEDMQLPEVPTHEQAARRWIVDSNLADTIRQHWQMEPECVADFLANRCSEGNQMLLQNILNGPVDIDKMDYLQRDSHHAGVPYGRNFDVSRLLSSIRIGNSDQMTISNKGKTAAEMMVFSRYVMFSEVYWHHGVRSATAMLQRAVFRLRSHMRFSDWSDLNDSDFQAALLTCSREDSNVSPLVEGLFGSERKLYKRLAQFSFSSSPEVYTALARRPYHELVIFAERLGQRLSEECQASIGINDFLIDAPPVKLEIQFRLQVQEMGLLRPLAELSPVVRALATDQFDNHVKMVRIFVAPHLRHLLTFPDRKIIDLLLECSS